MSVSGLNWLLKFRSKVMLLRLRNALVKMVLLRSIVVPYELYELYDWGKVPELYGTL